MYKIYIACRPLYYVGKPHQALIQTLLPKEGQMNKITTIVNFILDESGSMEDIKEATIAGFNKYLKALQKEKGTFLMTLTKFDTRGIRTLYTLTNVKDIRPLTQETYQPSSGTNLYDAIVETVEGVANNIHNDQPSLVAIMTDGQENSSTKHTEKCLRELIQKLEKRENWTFVFMGANQDSWAVAQSMGFSRGNVM